MRIDRSAIAAGDCNAVDKVIEKVEKGLMSGAGNLSTMRALAQQLLTLEEQPRDATDVPTSEAARVLERLRAALARFAGSEGFTSLVRRALALARAHDPSLRQLSVRADGSLEGLEQVSDDAVLAIIAQFLGLLVSFVGEPLTLRLVRDAWPDASFVEDMTNTRSIP